MQWLFFDEENTAVFTTRQIVRDGKPILYVSHDKDDGAWQFHTGSTAAMSDAMIVSLREILEIDETVNELFRLPNGWIATRSSKSDPWQIKEK